METDKRRLLFPFCRFTVRTPLNGGTANDFGKVFLTSTVAVHHVRLLDTIPPTRKGREGERERERETEREGERARGKEGKRERGREGEREKGREGERAGERERGRETERERESWFAFYCCVHMQIWFLNHTHTHTGSGLSAKVCHLGDAERGSKVPASR